jgi:ABC-type oligopeptide transport system ATPase subunit
LVDLLSEKLVEQAPTDALFARPRHPYTAALIRAAPIPDPRAAASDAILKGEVPSPAAPHRAATSIRAAGSPKIAAVASRPSCAN